MAVTREAVTGGVIQLQIWDEKISVDSLFKTLVAHGVALPIIKGVFREYLLIRKMDEYGIRIERSKEADRKMLETFRMQRQLIDDADFKAFLKREKLTEETLLGKIITAEKVQKLRQTVVTEDEIRDAFLKRKATMDRITFRLMRLPKLEQAQELYYRLHDDNEDFAFLTQKYSVGPEAKDGGLIGPLPINQMNPDLRQHLIKLQPGQISEPFTIDETVWLIAQVVRLEDMQLTEQMRSALLNERFENWVERQFQLAKIQVYDQNKQLELSPTDVAQETREDRVP